MARRISARKVPVVLNRLHGNPSGRRISPQTPEGVGVLLEPPSHFDDDQRAQWHHAIDNAPIGLLTETDRVILTAWVVAVVEHRTATIKVRELGQLVKTADGNLIQNPYLPIINRQAVLIRQLANEMGFTPASRASIGSHIGAPVDGRTVSGFRRSSTLSDFIEASPDAPPPSPTSH
jgi:P27 family predicted phage terminase small subunit